MPTSHSPIALSQHIQQLLQQRQQHASALAAIDATLARVSAALGVSKGIHVSSTPAAAFTAIKVLPTKTTKRRKGRRQFGTTANEAVLAFVKANKNPTTQEVNRHWKQQGRGGMADNTLSLLTKTKKLKRTPLGEGVRGSRYSLA